MADWFKVGEEGFKSKVQRDAFVSLKKEKNIPRFRLMPGEEAKVVFLDSNGFYILEHNLQVNGKWGNYVTCVSDMRPCPICQAGHRPVYTAYYSIIDGRSYVSNITGETVKNVKRLLPVKGSSINILQDIKNRYENLTGLVFRIKRTTANDPNCGNIFEKLGRIDLKKFPDSTPFDYKTVLAPPNATELEQMGFKEIVIGGTKEEELDAIFGNVEISEEEDEEDVTF